VGHIQGSCVAQPCLGAGGGEYELVAYTAEVNDVETVAGTFAETVYAPTTVDSGSVDNQHGMDWHFCPLRHPTHSISYVLSSTASYDVASNICQYLGSPCHPTHFEHSFIESNGIL